MKVESFALKPFKKHFAGNEINKTEQNFWYTRNSNYKPTFNDHKQEYTAGLLAFAAAVIALSRFLIKNSTPKSVVEIADKTLGLNKSEISKEFAESIKEKILYPIMSVKKGKLSLLMSRDFANGIIISGDNANKHSEAFIEQAEKLGIKVLKINDTSKSKANIKNAIYKAIAEAKKITKNDHKECVIIDLGEMDKAFKLSRTKAVKNNMSKIEKKITSLHNGIIWSGWTKNSNQIPYYYYNESTQLFTV